MSVGRHPAGVAAFLLVELWVAFLVVQFVRVCIEGSDRATMVFAPVFLGLVSAFLVKAVRVALDAQAVWVRWTTAGVLVLVVLPVLLVLAVASMGGIGKGMGGALAVMVLGFVLLAFVVAPLVLEGLCRLVDAMSLLAWRPLLFGLVATVLLLALVVEPVAFALLRDAAPDSSGPDYPFPIFGSWQPVLRR